MYLRGEPESMPKYLSEVVDDETRDQAFRDIVVSE